MSWSPMITKEQEQAGASFRAFVEEHVLPGADERDVQQEIPRALIRRLASAGYLGAVAPGEHGGADMDAITFGLLNEEIGRGCTSLRNVLTAHSMVIQAVARWGSEAQKERWLPRLSRGEVLGAFALSEPGVGSDARAVETEAARDGESVVIDGTKRWITSGGRAGLFLVFARLEQGPTAFLVPGDAPGLEREPITGMLGARASDLAQISLRGCRLPRTCQLGAAGLGIDTVASLALGLGRYSVAWGCVGLTRACLEASAAYAAGREQFGAPLADHQLIQRLVTEMITGYEAARLLCLKAGHGLALEGAGDLTDTMVAKYFASRAACRAARDAVQIHGASGCSRDYPVQRYLRDAKVMEIIEGSSQIQQVIVARYGMKNYLP